MSNSTLLPIQSTIPDVLIDLRYAGVNNIVGRKLYKKPEAMLRGEALVALQKAADKLRAQDLRLVVWDAYRPPAVQSALRQKCSDDKYVAQVSNHSRGMTVDVTLVDKSGKYLDMGTDFDEFSVAAHADTDQITEHQKHNRRLLKEAMSKAGFRQLQYEWWHFDFIRGGGADVIEQEL